MENKHGNFITISIVSFIILLSSSCSVLKHKSYLNNDFEIFFGSGFKNDTTSLFIDSVVVFEDEVLTTDFSTGIAELQVIYNYDNETIYINKGSRTKPFLNLSTKILNCTIIVNKLTIELRIDLRKGYFILFEKDRDSNNVSYRQFKKRPIFE